MPTTTFYFGKYNFGKGWDVNQVEQAKGIISHGIEKSWGPTKIYNELKGRGLGYSKTNVLYDISLAKATGRSKSTDAYMKAAHWFDTIETMRVDMGFKTRSETIKFWHAWKRRSEETLLRADELKALQEKGLYV